MSGLLASLPVHLACQLITADNSSFDNFTPTDTQLPHQEMIIPDGYTAFPEINLAYKYFNNSLTWNLARKHCVTEGGNLAVIDSVKKIEYAHIAQNTSTRGPWIGIHKYFDKTEWVSVKTGLPLSFIPWTSDLGSEGEPCAYLTQSGVAPGSNCHGAWAYLCEVPIRRRSLRKSMNDLHTVDIVPN